MELKISAEEKEILSDALTLYADSHTVSGSEKYKCVQRLLKRIEKPRITPRSAKSKGRNFQYWVCEQIAGLFGIEFKQSDDNCQIHSREMGLNGTDIILRGDVALKFPYSIECKCQEMLNIPSWWKQCKSNCDESKHPLLIIKKKSIGEPLVITDWNTFITAFNIKK